MNWSDVFVKVFGSSSSKNEMDLFNSWKQESSESVSKLSRLSKSSNELGQVDLTSYKQFDVDSAFAQSMSKINDHRKYTNLKYAAGALFVLALLAVGFSLNESKSDSKKLLESPDTHFAGGVFENTRFDGTTIAFEEHSDLQFDEEENSYKLKGAAFFDVVKQQKPLEIITSHGKVKVVGTAFDIKVEDRITTILMHEGLITFTDLLGRSYNVGEGQLLVAKDDEVTVQEKSTNQIYTYWRTNKLIYKNEPLFVILDDLSRLFNVSFPTITKNKGDLEVTVVFENSNIVDIINELETITGVSLRN